MESGRLNCRAEDQAGTVAHASEGPSGMIGPFADISILHIERVIIFAAGGRRGTEAVADLHALYRADGHDSLRQESVQLVKDRFAETCQADRRLCIL